MGSDAYQLHSLDSQDYSGWTSFEGRWGGFTPKRGPKLEFDKNGDESHASGNFWTRMFGQLFGWCYPKHNSPLTVEELLQYSLIRTDSYPLRQAKLKELQLQQQQQQQNSKLLFFERRDSSV